MDNLTIVEQGAKLLDELDKQATVVAGELVGSGWYPGMSGEELEDIREQIKCSDWVFKLAEELAEELY